MLDHLKTRDRLFAPGAWLCALALVAALVAPASAASVGKAKSPAAAPKVAAPVRTGLENLEKQVKEFMLPNGLRFIVVERHDAPVFSFETVVNAGGADEQVGITGIAHMMEHMAFKGTTTVGSSDWKVEKPLLDAEEQAWQAVLGERRKGAQADPAKLAALEQAFADAQTASHKLVVSNQFSKILEQAGAQDMNAQTMDDITHYFYSLPSNRLELWALMEGGRFTHPVFREFYKERQVVQEERRMGIESSPMGRLYDEFIHIAYQAHPYHFGVIGYASDLKTFSRTQGDEFFRAHYVAKNMTVAVVGDVTVPDVQKVAVRYFGDIPDTPPMHGPDTQEPEQKAERRVILEDPAQPVIMMGWHIPAATDPSYAAYKALASLLGGGDYARLNKTLRKERKIVTQLQVFTGLPGEKYPNMLGMFIVTAAGQDPLAVEKAVYGVLDSIQTVKPLTAEELDGYKVRMRAEKIGAVENNLSLAGELAQAQNLYGDWHQFFREQERVQSLTPDDLMAAMKRTLIASNRTVGLIVNPPKQAANEGGR
jgi:predicted Zn-dependent peptidase